MALWTLDGLIRKWEAVQKGTLFETPPIVLLYNISLPEMPCPVYDELHKQWEAAIREDSMALNPNGEWARRTATARLLERPARARRGLLAIEFKRNSHIDACVTCQADGRPKLDSSEARE